MIIYVMEKQKTPTREREEKKRDSICLDQDPDSKRTDNREVQCSLLIGQ